MKKIYLSAVIFMFLYVTGTFAQSTSISPSRLYFKASPGETKKQSVHVINNSTSAQTYAITFGDFDATGIDGKSQLKPAGESEHSSAKFMSATPSFFTLEPGKSQEIAVNIDLPNLPESNKVKWGTMMMKIVKERTEAQNTSKKDVGMGLVETFQFVVHIFQTPPNVTFKQAEIESFQEVKDNSKSGRSLALITKNTGEAILDCATYLEFSSLQSGNESRNKPSAFTLLPGSSRQIIFPFPDDLPKGKYTITAVIDFGSKDDVQAAQMDIEVK